MFCPNCGRDNSQEKKFCASCGTNLEAVSHALNGNMGDFFAKTNAALDQLIARYSEHVFKDSTSKLNDRTVGGSWKILGRGVATVFLDLILAMLMWNILPFRFLLLMFTTPFRLLSCRKSGKSVATGELEGNKRPAVAEPPSNKWLPGQFPSVSEHTTHHLEEFHQPERQRAARMD